MQGQVHQQAMYGQMSEYPANMYYANYQIPVQYSHTNFPNQANIMYSQSVSVTQVFSLIY